MKSLITIILSQLYLVSFLSAGEQSATITTQSIVYSKNSVENKKLNLAKIITLSVVEKENVLIISLTNNTNREIAISSGPTFIQEEFFDTLNKRLDEKTAVITTLERRKIPHYILKPQAVLKFQKVFIRKGKAITRFKCNYGFTLLYDGKFYECDLNTQISILDKK